MYAFGCSLGAVILALYMAFEGKRAAKYLDGAVLYATPWNTRDSFHFFCNAFFGLYAYAIGINLNKDLKNRVLPAMKDLMGEEEYEYYRQALENNRVGLPVLDSQVFTKMYGYRDVWHYYDYCTIADKLLKIRVPTFALSACDDQIAGDAFVPRKQAQAPDSHICIGVTDFGSHVSHMTGRVFPKTWYPLPCMEFIEFLESRLQYSNTRTQSGP